MYMINKKDEIDIFQAIALHPVEFYINIPSLKAQDTCSLSDDWWFQYGCGLHDVELTVVPVSSLADKTPQGDGLFLYHWLNGHLLQLTFHQKRVLRIATRIFVKCTNLSEIFRNLFLCCDVNPSGFAKKNNTKNPRS